MHRFQTMPIIPVIAVSLLATIALAQSATPTTKNVGADDAALANPRHPTSRLEAATRLQRVVNVAWENAPLEQVFDQFEEAAGLTITPMWIAEPGTVPARVITKPRPGTTEAPAAQTPVPTPPPPDEELFGLHKDTTITFKANSITLQHALEIVLSQADASVAGLGSTWQISSANTIQVGPRERLNRYVRIETYDVTNLLQVILDNRIANDDWVRAAPKSMFPRNAGFADNRPTADRAEDLRQLIIASCEPDAWRENGGDSTITWSLASRCMVVRAPDYVHRTIDGYRDDPAAPTDILQPPKPQRTTKPAPTTKPATPAGS
ncbi:hypothetical protein LBMAG48_11030 [Phycisphaerae bacterium]|nr:hypothetical protein LBMAG48_11030 [Phycisphaerae bacterium]